MPDLRFAVLGPIRAWRGDTELDLATPQQRAVLAVLLLAEGRQVSLAALVDALWADDPPAASVGTVRTYISRLRRCLRAASGARGEVIESAGDGYCLPLRRVALDLTVFLERTREAHVAAGAGDAEQAADLLRDALGLWRGVPLAGIPGQYAESQRVRLAALQMAALEERLALDISLGRHVAAAVELQTLLASDPMRERLSELLMLALYRSGRQADALAVFGHTRRLLSEELGIDPGSGLHDMHQRILQADESLIGPAGRDSCSPPAPSPVTALVGRAVQRRSSRYPVVGFGAGGNDKGPATADSRGRMGCCGDVKRAGNPGTHGGLGRCRAHPDRRPWQAGLRRPA